MKSYKYAGRLRTRFPVPRGWGSAGDKAAGTIPPLGGGDTSIGEFSCALLPSVSPTPMLARFWDLALPTHQMAGWIGRASDSLYVQPTGSQVGWSESGLSPH